MGAGEMPAFLPTLASVSLLISSRILLKSKNFWPGMWRNSPHSSMLAALSVRPTSSFSSPLERAGDSRLMSWRTSGRRVTMPEPRGRLYRSGCQLANGGGGKGRGGTYKSRPTMFSNTELLPLD